MHFWCLQCIVSAIYAMRCLAFSFVKKVRMGKRIEKAFGRDKGQPSAGQGDLDNDPNKTPGNCGCSAITMASWYAKWP